MFADDLIVLGKASVQEAQSISQIIDHLCHSNFRTGANLEYFFSKHVTS